MITGCQTKVFQRQISASRLSAFEFIIEMLAKDLENKKASMDIRFSVVMEVKEIK